MSQPRPPAYVSRTRWSAILETRRARGIPSGALSLRFFQDKKNGRARGPTASAGETPAIRKKTLEPNQRSELKVAGRQISGASRCFPEVVDRRLAGLSGRSRHIGIRVGAPGRGVHSNLRLAI